MSSTSVSCDRLTSWSTQKSGRLNVVMPIDTVPWRTLSVSKPHEPAITTASDSPASTSYQYQPPSMNGLSGRSKVSVFGLPVSKYSDSARWTWPLAVERYTLTVPSPRTVTWRRTWVKSLHRRQ